MSVCVESYYFIREVLYDGIVFFSYDDYSAAFLHFRSSRFCKVSLEKVS